MSGPRLGGLQLIEASPLRPLFVEERGHGRDGELLRDFIMRKEHLKEDCLAGGAFFKS